MADLQFEPSAKTVVIRPLNERGREWANKHIDLDPGADGSLTVPFSDAPAIEHAAREDGLAVAEMAL
jgi:hypothetical protein